MLVLTCHPKEVVVRWCTLFVWLDDALRPPDATSVHREASAAYRDPCRSVKKW